MDTWLIILLCTVFALIVIGADFYFKLVWLPERRERKETQGWSLETVNPQVRTIEPH